MQIQDLKSFLSACSNVCVIKRKSIVEEEKEDSQKKRKQSGKNLQEETKAEKTIKKPEGPKKSDFDNMEENNTSKTKKIVPEKVN